MTSDFQNFMRDAGSLMRAGDLQAATAAIQAALQGRASMPAAASPAAANADVIDVEARVLPGTTAQPAAEPRAAHAGPAGSAAAAAPAEPAGRFTAGRFADASDGRDYKLYQPPGAAGRALPLVVMLHGCTQNPDDFAAGTAMNALAREQGFYVLYPAQSSKANPQRCWNWFKHTHQQRGRGEPALIAGMTREVMAAHGIDPQRVYVAGLSAGGAMAAILGHAYPDLYAAVGVHSGLAAGAAADLPSALAAMKSGAKGAGTPADAASGMPTIAFHGDADATVHPSNAAQVMRSSVGAGAASDRREVAGQRRATVQQFRDAAGRVRGEQWTVHGAAHAWSGGNSAGSYADPAGPDASAEMLRFFLAHPKSPAA